MILDTTTKKLQVVLAAPKTTNQLQLTAAWGDTQSGDTFVPGASTAVTNDTTPVDLVIAPIASTQRTVREVTVYNSDTVAAKVFVQTVDGANTRIYASPTIEVGETLFFSNGEWYTLAVNGARKSSAGVTSVAFTGDGTVFNAAVPGSPITTAGTFAPTLHTQAANVGLFGPTTGAAAAPLFRSLVAADIPSLSGIYLPLAGGTMSGAINLPNGAAGTPSLAFNTGYGFFYDSGNSATGIALAGAEIGFFGSQFYYGEGGAAIMGQRMTASYAPTTFPNSTVYCMGVNTIGSSGGASSDPRAMVFSVTLSGAVGFLTGTAVQGTVNNGSTGTVAQQRGFVGSMIVNAASTVQQLESFQAAFSVSAGVVTESRGLLVSAMSVTGTGAVTDAYGVRVNAQKSAGVTNGWGFAQFGTTDANLFAGSMSVGKTTAASTKLDARASDAVTAAITDVRTVEHDTSGVAAAGFGAGEPWYLENAAGTLFLAARAAVRWLVATAGAEDSEWVWSTSFAGTLAERARLTSRGYFVSPGNSRVTADFTKTNDAALANVTGLTVNVGAGKTYHFEAWLPYTADAVGGHKYAIAGTATATDIRYHITSVADATNLNVITATQVALAGASGQAGSVGGDTRISGTITVNAGGTLTVQFAQNAATPATSSSVKRGATFSVTEID